LPEPVGDLVHLVWLVAADAFVDALVTAPGEVHDAAITANVDPGHDPGDRLHFPTRVLDLDMEPARSRPTMGAKARPLQRSQGVRPVFGSRVEVENDQSPVCSRAMSPEVSVGRLLERERLDEIPPLSDRSFLVLRPVLKDLGRDGD
jgi:hypothetical protein